MKMDNRMEKLELCTDFFGQAGRSIKEEMPLAGQYIKGVRLEREDFSALSLRECCLENCVLTDCQLQKCDFQNVWFCSCDFSGCDFSESYFYRCRFHTVKAMGVNLTYSLFRETDAVDCSFQYANFSFSKLEKTKWEEADFRRADLPNCKLKEFHLVHAKFIETSFFHTPLAGVDFTNSEIMALSLSESNEELKGAIVNIDHAAELAKRMGLVVK